MKFCFALMFVLALVATPLVCEALSGQCSQCLFHNDDYTIIRAEVENTQLHVSLRAQGECDFPLMYTGWSDRLECAVPFRSGSISVFSTSIISFLPRYPPKETTSTAIPLNLTMLTRAADSAMATMFDGINPAVPDPLTVDIPWVTSGLVSGEQVYLKLKQGGISGVPLPIDFDITPCSTDGASDTQACYTRLNEVPASFVALSYDLADIFSGRAHWLIRGDANDIENLCGEVDPLTSTEIDFHRDFLITYSISQTEWKNRPDVKIEISFNTFGPLKRNKVILTSATDPTKDVPKDLWAIINQSGVFQRSSVFRKDSRTGSRWLIGVSESSKWWDSSKCSNQGEDGADNGMVACYHPLNPDSPVPPLDRTAYFSISRKFRAQTPCVAALRAKLSPFFDATTWTLLDPINNNPFYSAYDLFCFYSRARAQDGSGLTGKTNRFGTLKGTGGMPSCANGGTLLFNSRCNCPSGFAGFDCSTPVPVKFQSDFMYGLSVMNMMTNTGTLPNCSVFDPCGGLGLCRDIYFLCMRSNNRFNQGTDIRNDYEDPALIAKITFVNQWCAWSTDRGVVYENQRPIVKLSVTDPSRFATLDGFAFVGKTVECACNPGYFGSLSIHEALKYGSITDGLYVNYAAGAAGSLYYPQGLQRPLYALSLLRANLHYCDDTDATKLAFSDPNIEIESAYHQCEIYDGKLGAANFSFPYDDDDDRHGTPTYPPICFSGTDANGARILYGGSGCVRCPPCDPRFGVCVDKNPSDPFADGAPRICKCDPLHGGETCTLKRCPFDNTRDSSVLPCNSQTGNGVCHEELPPVNASLYMGRCVCAPGFVGDDCAQRACVVDNNGRSCSGNGVCYSYVCDQFWVDMERYNRGVTRDSSLPLIENQWFTWVTSSAQFYGNTSSYQLKPDYDVVTGQFLRYNDTCVTRSATGLYKCLCNPKFIRESPYGTCVEACPMNNRAFFADGATQSGSKVASISLECNGVMRADGKGTVCDRTAPGAPLCRCHLGLKVSTDDNPCFDTVNHDIDGYFGDSCQTRYRQACAPAGDQNAADGLQLCSNNGKCVVCENFPCVNITLPNACQWGGLPAGTFTESLSPRCRCFPGFEGTWCEKSACKEASQPAEHACTYLNFSTGQYDAHSGQCISYCQGTSGGVVPCNQLGQQAYNASRYRYSSCNCATRDGYYYTGDGCTLKVYGCSNPSPSAASTAVCSGNGECRGRFDTGSTLGTNFSCVCDSAHYGTYCESTNFCPSCNTKGGVCANNSLTGAHYCRCYETFTGANCTINRCNATGGETLYLANGTTECICPHGTTWINDPSRDLLGCRVMCPVDAQQHECGSPNGKDVTQNYRCNNTALFYSNDTYLVTQKAALSCLCATRSSSGWMTTGVNAQGERICVPYCLNDCVPDPDITTKACTCPSPCQWLPSAGGVMRCEISICNNRGTYNTTTQKCDCFDEYDDVYTGVFCNVTACGALGYIDNTYNASLFTNTHSSLSSGHAFGCACNTSLANDSFIEKTKGHPNFGACVRSCGSMGRYNKDTDTCVCVPTFTGRSCEVSLCSSLFPSQPPDFSTCTCQNVTQWGGTYCKTNLCDHGLPHNDTDPLTGRIKSGCVCANPLVSGDLCDQHNCHHGVVSNPNDPSAGCICDAGWAADSNGACSTNLCLFDSPPIACPASVCGPRKYKCDCFPPLITFDVTTGTCVKNTCNDHGRVIKNSNNEYVCDCVAPYKGDRCETLSCNRPSARVNGMCQCLFPFSGDDCNEYDTRCGPHTRGPPFIYDTKNGYWACNCSLGYASMVGAVCMNLCNTGMTFSVATGRCECDNHLYGFFCNETTPTSTDATTGGSIDSETRILSLSVGEFVGVVVGSVVGGVALIVGSVFGVKYWRRTRGYNTISAA